MKAITVRLPDALAADIETESRARGLSKSDIVRERLEGVAANSEVRPPLADIADLVGSIEGLPADLSSRKKDYLRATGYGRKRPR
ncbi:MAG: ribbon-helix-helix protein, CopG family [Rudaea sp.]